MRTELGEPFVVNAKTGALQIGIVEPEQRHSERRVQHLRLDAVDLLILDALDGVPSTGTRRLVAPLHMIAQLLAAATGAEAARYWKRADARRDEDIALAVRALLHMGRAIPELLVEPRLPEIR